VDDEVEEDEDEDELMKQVVEDDDVDDADEGRLLGEEVAHVSSKVPLDDMEDSDEADAELDVDADDAAIDDKVDETERKLESIVEESDDEVVEVEMRSEAEIESKLIEIVNSTITFNTTNGAVVADEFHTLPTPTVLELPLNELE
jgi:hypothetical protein